jgi:predicted unusual protein kinase regulating ubiquinone biosynthesis (AarF/ABC1/UbiB family)
MFPEELCRALSALHAGAPVHAERHTRARVEALFGGRALEEVFDWFDAAPMASGSIAQVTAAVAVAFAGVQARCRVCWYDLTCHDEESRVLFSPS